MAKQHLQLVQGEREHCESDSGVLVDLDDDLRPADTAKNLRLTAKAETHLRTLNQG